MPHDCAPILSDVRGSTLATVCEPCGRLISAGEPAVTDHVRDQNRRYFPGIAHGTGAEAKSPVAGGKGMAALPCCTNDDAATGSAGPAFGS